MATSAPVFPNRKTHVIFDSPRVTLAEPVSAVERSGASISKGGPTAKTVSTMTLLGSGTWQIESYQDTPSGVHETTAGAASVLRLSDWNLVTGYTEKKQQRQDTDLPGLPAYQSGVQSSGDYFLQRDVPASGNWGESLTADVTSFGKPPENDATLTLSRHGVTKVAYPNNQGWTLRVFIPGVAISHSKYIANFIFGGPSGEAGSSGYYCLQLAGDGIALVWIKNGVNSTDWKSIDAFRWAEPHSVNGEWHVIQIIPHASPRGGGNIEFQCRTGDEALPSPGYGYGLVSAGAGGAGPRTHITRVNAYQGVVTGIGLARLDVRPNTRIKVQVSQRKFKASGFIRDYPMQVPGFVTGRGNLTLLWEGKVPAGTSFTAQLFDADTDVECTVVSTAAASKVYKTNQGQANYYAKFTFTASSDGLLSPSLTSYSIVHNGSLYASTTTAKEVNALEFEDMRISGPESDPSHETASFIVRDLRSDMASLLGHRGQIPVRIETEYDTNPALRSILFEGYASKAIATRKGTGGTYPAATWRDFDVLCSGMWTRLAQQLTFVRKNLGNDPSASTADAATPYKITDIIRELLLDAGYASYQLDIPDIPIRYFPPVSGSNGDELILDPLTSVGDFCIKMAKDYLGAFLIWDSNAGSAGMWRVISPPYSPYTALYNFTTSGAGAGKLQHVVAAYAANTSYIKKGTLQTWVVAPEANFVYVTGTGELLNNKGGQQILCNYAINVKSYDFLADSSGAAIPTADPTNPDYLGSFVPLVVVDTSLTTQAAVDVACRRYYDFTCHAIKMASFDAPLVLITNSADAQQTKPRPLRYYDPITIDGATWLVRNVNPTYRKDSVQFAHYEVESPRL